MKLFKDNKFFLEGIFEPEETHYVKRKLKNLSVERPLPFHADLWHSWLSSGLVLCCTVDLYFRTDRLNVWCRVRCLWLFDTVPPSTPHLVWRLLEVLAPDELTGNDIYKKNYKYSWKWHIICQCGDHAIYNTQCYFTSIYRILHMYSLQLYISVMA